MKESETPKQANCSCPYCEDTITTESPTYCQPCGIKEFTCPSCGTPVPKRRQTCPNCGGKIRRQAKS